MSSLLDVWFALHTTSQRCAFPRFSTEPGVTYTFPQQQVRGHFVAGFDGSYLLIRETISTGIDTPPARRLVVKRWSMLHPNGIGSAIMNIRGTAMSPDNYSAGTDGGRSAEVLSVSDCRFVCCGWLTMLTLGCVASVTLACVLLYLYR